MRLKTDSPVMTKSHHTKIQPAVYVTRCLLVINHVPPRLLPTEAAQGAAENSFNILSDQQEEKTSPPRKKDIQLRWALPGAHSRSPWGKAAHSLSTDAGGPMCHGMPTPWNSPTSMLRLYNVLLT